MILITGSSPPLDNVIYSDIIYISLDPLTRGEFCVTVNDFRTRLDNKLFVRIITNSTFIIILT